MPTSPSAPGAAVAARLDALRGPVPPRSHDARTIAALTVNPGCSRRAVLDAAGIDKRRLAERVGSPARFGQSPFAITRGLMFEKQIKADGCVQLLELLRTELGFDVPAHEYVDLGVEPSSTTSTSAASIGGTLDRGTRHLRTRELFARVAEGAAVLADHPLLTLDVAGRTAYVEPDVVAVRARRHDASLLYVTEIKSFAVIDGQADPTKVGAAATQSAVYVLALRRLFASLGVDPEIVASDVILVCPKDFSNSPTAHLVDVRRQLAAVSRQLDRLPRIEALIAALDPAIDFDLSVDQPHDTKEVPHPRRSAAELSKSLAMVEARYAPECMTRCELAFHCRAEARAAGAADALGRSVRDALGGIASIDEVLRMAAGDARLEADAQKAGSHGSDAHAADGYVPSPRQFDGDEAARLLRAAARAYDEAMAMEPRVAEIALAEAGTGGGLKRQPRPAVAAASTTDTGDSTSPDGWFESVVRRGPVTADVASLGRLPESGARRGVEVLGGTSSDRSPESDVRRDGCAAADVSSGSGARRGVEVLGDTSPGQSSESDVRRDAETPDPAASGLSFEPGVRHDPPTSTVTTSDPPSTPSSLPGPVVAQRSNNPQDPRAPETLDPARP